MQKPHFSSEHLAESSDELFERAQLGDIMDLVKEMLNKNHEYSFKLIEFIQKSTKLNELPIFSMNDSESIAITADLSTKDSHKKILQNEIVEMAKEMLNKNNEYAFILNKIIDQSIKSNEIQISPTNDSEPIQISSDIHISTKITNLNTECMESIFEHLEMNDLLNVVDSNKQFYAAAFQVFRRKYKNTYFILGSDINYIKRYFLTSIYNYRKI